MLQLILKKPITDPASKPERTFPEAHGRQWAAYNAAKINQRFLFPILLHALCSGIDEPEQHRGRPRLLLRDMIFCAVLKVYSKSPLRQFTHEAFVAHCQQMIKRVPHFNSISNYLRMELLTEKLTKLIEMSSLPLETVEADFAIDSTGLSTCRYARWQDERQLKERKRREWIKVHLVCGVKTNIVASVITTLGSEADSPHFGRLVEVAARNFQMKEIYADKGYSGAENLRYAMLANATPFIPFKSNNRLDADYKSTFWKQMLHMYLYRRAEFLAHYNKRNNVETTFHMIKSNFGSRLLSISRQAQFNEALCKVLCHNLCVLIQSMYELGIDTSFCSESVYNSKSDAKPLGQAMSSDQCRKLRDRIPALLKKFVRKLAR